ncbi:MAG TPA: F0F1 ATP synthase subunit A [Acidimicrobiales bacterium]|nr:F0F1 ATP synthase subunit A [Acidimicrobiales bacterium]
MQLLALEFPPISHLVEWPDFFANGQWYALNKVGALCLLSMLFTLIIFFVAGSRAALVPTGVQNIAEASVDFVRDGIVLQTMGEEGMHRKWVMPFLTSLFWFILFANIFEIIPGVQMPATARMALPALLAILVWFIFNGVGIANQGLGGYLKNSLFPPGVPKALYILVTPIELISTFVVRPFSLAVRLFANLLAGHILLVTFAVLATALYEAAGVLKIVTVLPFVMLVFLTGFEILVSFLQAYIFTILAAVYIGGAMHPEH